MIREAFKNPIPVAEAVVEAGKKEKKEVQEMEVT
jgi:hypothetical protein